MVTNETELFFIVLLIILTVIMHSLLTWKGPRHGGKAK